MNPDVYVHNLDPFAIQFGENGFRFLGFHLEGIRWYGLAYLAGFIVGYFTIKAMAKRKTTPMKENEVADFITMVAFGTMIGGRLGYCLFYAPHLLFDFTSAFPFWGALRVTEGGMSSHGGMIGVILVCVWWARTRKMNVFHTIDLVVFGGAMGFFFGRLANFVNGELWGREAPPDLSWAVKFPGEIYGWTRDNLTRLSELAPAVEKLGEFQTAKGEVVKVTAESWKNWVQNYRTDVQSWNFVNEGVEKLIQATQTANLEVTQALAPFLTPRYPSQLIQSVLEGLLVFIILNIIWLKPRKPGVVGAWFGILYAIARIIGEQFRMPDAHIGFELFGLTRGQWLSIAMLLMVTVYLIWSHRRDTEPMGGWDIKGEMAKK